MKKIDKEKLRQEREEFHKNVKADMKKARENAKNEAGEFKKFISRGKVVDMAVGVIVGGAFGKIITSLVNEIITPLIGIVIGGLDFSNLSVQVNDAKIAYGAFIQSVIDFLLVAICVFIVIRMVQKIKDKVKKAEEVVEEEAKSEEVVLLQEIRDLLKKSNEVENEKINITNTNIEN